MGNQAAQEGPDLAGTLELWEGCIPQEGPRICQHCGLEQGIRGLGRLQGGQASWSCA